MSPGNQSVHGYYFDVSHHVNKCCDLLTRLKATYNFIGKQSLPVFKLFNV